MNDWGFIKEDFVEMTAGDVDQLRESKVPESQLGAAAIACAINRMTSKLPELFWHEAVITGKVTELSSVAAGLDHIGIAIDNLPSSDVGGGDLAQAVRSVARAISLSSKEASEQ